MAVKAGDRVRHRAEARGACTRGGGTDGEGKHTATRLNVRSKWMPSHVPAGEHDGTAKPRLNI